MKRTGHGHVKGHTSKHSGTHKHHAHGAKHHPTRQSAHHHTAHHQHHVHTKAKHHHHARGLALGDALPVCSFEAVAMSLRLLGQRVSDDDVLELWHLAGAREVSIAEALEAAATYGLAGYDLGSRNYLPAAERECGVLCADGLDAASFAVEAHAFPPVALEVMLHRPVDQAANDGPHALILGVDLPGPHAVLATPDGWWSWGALYDRSAFPHAVIEEAWAVTWT